MKYAYFLIGLLSAMAVSCSVNEIVNPEQDNYNQSPNVVHAAIVDEPSGVDTKVYADSKLRVLWNEDDCISYFAKTTYNGQFIFLGEDGDNAGSFAEIPNSNPHTGNDVSNHYAVYPYQLKTSLTNDEIIRFTLPAEQTYKKDSFGIGANTMASKTPTNELKFKNVGGYLSFKFYGEGISVSSITLKGNNGEKLAGKCTIDMSSGEPSVTMDQEKATEEITLTCDPPVALGSSSSDYIEFWMVVPPMTFSKGITFTVTTADGKTWEKQTTASFDLPRNVKRSLPALEVEVAPFPEVVDLGLSVKWASCNVGATRPEEFGKYYAFGETKGYGEDDFSNSSNFAWNNYSSYIKTDFLWDSYKWNAGGSSLALTKYSDAPEFGYKGFIDDKTVLEPQDDAASVNWGTNWRTPTKAEWEELINNSNCDWTIESVNGINGFRVTSKKEGFTDASIFLPFAGNYSQKTYYNTGTTGSYMSSNIKELPSNIYDACLQYTLKIYFENQGSDGNHFMNITFRECGYSVRPVYYQPENGVLGVELNQFVLRLNVNESADLSATVFPENAPNKSLTWLSSDASVATVSASGRVTALKMGTATITVTTVDNHKTANCIVNVVEETGAID